MMPGICAKCRISKIPFSSSDIIWYNNFNKRVRITPKELLDIVFNSGNPLRPRPEDSIYLGGRNKHFYFDEGVYPNKDGEGGFKMDFSKFVIKE